MVWTSLALALLFAAMMPAERASAADVATRDGKLIVDGKPFFAFGFFANVGDPMRDLEAAGSSGFNIIQCNNKCDDAYYAKAAQLGIYVVHELAWPDPKSSVEFARAKPPLLAFYVADDMNITKSCASPRYTPTQVAERTAQIRKYGVTTPTTGALALSDECTVTPYADSVDILQGFNYPVDNWEPRSTWLERNAQTVKMLVDAGGGRKPVIADSQSFAWPGKRLPTPGESRNMNYAALALGVSGIMMYTLSEPDGFFLPHAGPDLWEELKTQAAEVRSMQDMLLEGTRMLLQAGPHVYAAAWTQGARTLVIVVNTDRSETRTVALSLPPDSNTSLRPAFPRYQSRLAVSEGTLSGPVGAEEVQVLKGSGPGDEGRPKKHAQQ